MVEHAIPEVLLDLTGLRCPLPLLRLKIHLKSIEPGSLLWVATSDPASQRDFAAFAAQQGHRLEETFVRDDRFYFLVQKAVA